MRTLPLAPGACAGGDPGADPVVRASVVRGALRDSWERRALVGTRTVNDTQPVPTVPGAAATPAGWAPGWGGWPGGQHAGRGSHGRA